MFSFNGFHRISLDHVVILARQQQIFVAGYDRNNRLKVFLISRRTGEVFSRNTQKDAWEPIQDAVCYRSVHRELARAYARRTIPFLRVRSEFSV